MSYYMGDFYRGDYYAGDPGFFGFLGKAVRGVSRIVRGVRRPALPATTGAIGAGAPSAAGVATAGAMVRRGVEAIRQHPVLTAAGAAGVAGILGGVAPPAGAPHAMQRGFHISRKTGRVVRNRRMRVTNVKALRRAIRRAHGFEKIARRVMHFTSPRRVKGKAVFRRRRTKRM